MFKLPVICLLLLPFTFITAKEAKPLYEWGVVGGVARTPHYPAAADSSTYYLTFPSFIYRGLTFRNDDKGFRARFLTTTNLDLDLSFGGSFPADSEDNKARSGMDDLDLLLEFGPRLSYILHKNNGHEWEIELPLRYVFSTDFNFTSHRGYRLQPQLDYRYKFFEYFILSMGYKLNYATEKLSDYFYEVDDKDIIPNIRERYNASAGYIGQDLSVSFMVRYFKFFGIIGVRTSQYHDASNEESPLFKSRENSSTFIAFNYFFYASEEKAPKNKYLRTPTQ
ncbi:MAG: hypothetical protein CME62_05265 [Halobacteriovoraceae bacterium]|nr:hypothetical protein [Halobacteriovoraceae bacterium]|tara:strand:- start:1477 stop:2316 length:840 start_codon:yes stop_codon:yes gene_type:complete